MPPFCPCRRRGRRRCRRRCLSRWMRLCVMCLAVLFSVSSAARLAATLFLRKSTCIASISISFSCFVWLWFFVCVLRTRRYVLCSVCFVLHWLRRGARSGGIHPYGSHNPPPCSPPRIQVPTALTNHMYIHTRISLALSLVLIGHVCGAVC